MKQITHSPSAAYSQPVRNPYEPCATRQKRHPAGPST